MFTTGAVTLVTCSYMQKNGGEAPGQGAVGATCDRAVEICGPLAFISWLPHLVCSGEAPGQGAVGARQR